MRGAIERENRGKRVNQPPTAVGPYGVQKVKKDREGPEKRSSPDQNNDSKSRKKGAPQRGRARTRKASERRRK